MIRGRFQSFIISCVKRCSSRRTPPYSLPMDSAFKYTPRFVDIRIKPPKEEAEAAAAERVCDWASCKAPGVCRAPKSAERLNEHYYFCPAHAAEYNKNWNFFSEMSDAEVTAFQKGAAFGHRPTWNMGSGARQRDAATRAKSRWSSAFADRFGMFGGEASSAQETQERRRKLGRLERKALETLGVDRDADAKTIRARYTELVKQLHPDMNGGDRSSEQRLQSVIQAYQMLKKAELI